MTETLWILCALLVLTAGDVGDRFPPEDVSCPEGARVRLPSLRCYWLSERRSSWSEAQVNCREIQGGDLAAADSLELQDFIHRSFPTNTTVWVWLKGSRDEGFDQEPSSPAWWAGRDESSGGCALMTLGSPARWRNERCAEQHRFLCERQQAGVLATADSYLTGLVLMTGVYARTQIQPLLSAPDAGQHTVELQLFPGLWFGHAGQLVTVELVVRPSPLLSLARMQILRPYCDPNFHLVPPGCSSLLNPFSCCSAVPLCNTTGGCSLGQYWCHLLDTCVPTTSPCSPYDPAAGARGYELPPRYVEKQPFYHTVADLPLRISPSSELKTINLLLPGQAIMVYPDDVVAVQHTRSSGALLHCIKSEASVNSPWRQSYLSLRGAEQKGWWKGGLASPSKKGQWVDGVVCDLRMLYVDNLHRGTEQEHSFDFSHTKVTAAPDIRPTTVGPAPSLTAKFEPSVIYPLPDAKNQIHVRINVPTRVVVKALFGEKARSSWSTPVLQRGVPFLPSCPEEVVLTWPDCERHFRDAWFSSVTLAPPSAGVQTMNITVTDDESSESVSVIVRAYELVTGLSIEPRGHSRMLVDVPQVFVAKLESGSSVKFTWVLDNVESFPCEGETCSVLFKKPAEYKLKVTASNPVSSQSQQLLLAADEMAPLAEPEFLFVSEVVAANATHLYRLRVKADISLPVTFRWDFGDGHGKIFNTHTAPHTERKIKQVYVEDSVNYTYSIPDEYTLYVQVDNQYDSTETSVKIKVRPQLSHVQISFSPSVPFNEQPLLLEASTEPSTDSVFYTWDFDDGSRSLQGIHHRVSHAFGYAGIYNVTVCADNTVTALTTWVRVEVMEKIFGLTVSSSGPSEVSCVTDFRAKVATGTSPIWNFDFGDGSLQENHTDGSVSHIYTSPGNYTVDVTVLNAVSKVHQSITVEVYRLAVSEVLPTECIITGKDMEFIALVNGNTSILTFHWQFGDGSPVTVVTGQSSAKHLFPSPGLFNVSLTVFSSVMSVIFNTSICVETSITNMTVKSSQDVAAEGEEVCFRVLVYPEQLSGYWFSWFSNCCGIVAVTQNSQKCFVFKDEGVEELLVMASNKVSNKTAKASVAVQKPVSKLSVMYDGRSDMLVVHTPASFWVASCTGSNVSVLWDFGDGSPVERRHNASHVFTSTGQFTVKATAFNTVSQESVAVTINIVLPVWDLSLHTNRSYAVAGEETLITAVSSDTSDITNYYWTVDTVTSTTQGSHQFRFVFLKPGVYQVRVTAQAFVSRREAAILIEVFERIEGLRIECRSHTNVTYVPTQVELQFVAFFTKGSNVSCHWLALQSRGNQQTTGDGELFHLLAKAPGRISVQLRASNKLGEATSAMSLVAVEYVTTAHITTQSSTVALGNLMNISVSVVTGSDLEYLWYVNSDTLTVRTQAPFLVYTFTRLGECLVRVSVQNVLGQSNDTKRFVVEEEVQEADFKIEGETRPFYISSSDAVLLCGVIRKGSGLHWNWTVGDPKGHLLTATNQTFLYNFSHVGTYQVFLNVSNGLNWQVVSHRVVVQDRIEGLHLSISKSFVCTEEKVTFIPSVSRGSDASFSITFRNEDWIYTQYNVEGTYTTSNLPVGSNLVMVEAWNQVSSAEFSTDIVVIKRVHGLRLLNCCSLALEALKGFYLKAEVQSGFPVNYTWIFHSVMSGPALLMGQEVFFTPAESGSVSVSVVASNRACSSMLNDTITVEWPVKKLELVCYSERMFAGHAVRFAATTEGGSNLRYQWDFGDFTDVLVTESNSVDHTYKHPGGYTVMVTVLNGISHMSAQLHMKVEDLQCASPQASLVQSQSTIFRSRPSFFEASVNNNCSAHKTMYLWEIFRGSNCSSGNTIGNRVILSGRVDATSPLVFLPKNTLSVGQHCLVFTVSLHGSPLFVQRTTNVTVIHSPLVATIKGGSHRLWSSLRNLTLDGSNSQDPDVEAGEEASLQYRWTFFTANSAEPQLINGPTGSDSSKLTVLGTQLHAGTVYVFTLTVHKPGRTPASVNQTVTVSRAPMLPVTVDCPSCSVLSSTHCLSYTDSLVLAGECGQCDDQTQAQYEWRAESQTGAILDLDEVTTSTGRHSPNLVVRSGVLQPGLSYTFTLNVSLPGRGHWGIASLFIPPNNPPHGGLCDLSPRSHVRLLENVVTYNCSGWQDDETEASQLIYSLHVAPCQVISNACPMLCLYRGIRSTFSSMVPTGDQWQGKGMSVITVVLLVEDHLGAKVTALNRTLNVEIATKNEDVTRWLKSKSQEDLWALVQQGNPQEIIPYTVVLACQLNKMQAAQSVGELEDRKEIRENVTQALASLPISSLLDVDQISSALAQSTAVPSEFLSKSCQKHVLKAVEKMIRLMEDQMTPAALSAVHTGRNILSILGSTLAAVSAAAGSFGARSSHSGSMSLASTLSLSALSHAGALMRALVRSRARGEAPLLLSGPHVSVVGLRGEPSDLVCADRPKTPHPCPFYIPSSLTAHLKSQTSEVVQVLIVMDGALESIASLTAADPPISTSLAAMELTTPQGRPIRVEHLEAERAIRLTLPNKRPVEQGAGGGNERAGDAGNGTCLTVTLPTEEPLNFMIKTLDELDENAGLYLSFDFSLAPGGTPVRLGHVKIDVSASGPWPNASQESPVTAWDLTLSAENLSTEKTLFLSPLLNRTNQPLSVNLTSVLAEGGPVRLSLCVFSSVCQYYDMQEKRWSSEGLQPLEGSTLHEVHCLTRHLTVFGASLFVHPGAVVLLQPAAGPVHNIMAGIVCTVLALIHLLVWLIAHKLDHLDSLRLSQVPLSGRPGLYHYRVLVKTGWKRGAGTTAHVGISLYGVNKSGSRHLQRDGAFQRCSLDQFHLETDDNLGEIWKIRIWHDNTGLDPSWYVQHVVVWDAQTDHLFFFLLNDWLSVESERNGAVEREILASCPEELSEFQRVLTSQLMFGMMQRHMWLSLWQSPAHSRFTRGQRVSCSAIIWHLYLALGAFWYGAVGTKEHSGPVSAHLLVNMETVAVGMTLASLVFPLQCFLGFLFRKAHSKVAADMSGSPSPVCHSVEMDIYVGQSVLSGPWGASPSGSSGPVRDGSTSLMESKGVDSSILDFWAASGLAPQTNGPRHDKGVDARSSCGSLFDLPPSSCRTKTSPVHDLHTTLPVVSSSHPLRRKKALMELRPVAPASSNVSSAHLALPGTCHCSKATSGFSNSPAAPGQEACIVRANPVQGHKHKLATFLTLSEEDLLMSIAAAAEDPACLTKSSSDSGWDSPRIASSLSTTWSTSCSSWSDQSEDNSLCAADVHRPDPRCRSSLYGTGLHTCPSLLSVNSVASTFLPSPSPDSARSTSTTRIGIARGPPSWLLPPWALCVIYPLLAILLGACLAVTGLYGSYFSKTVILMWLVSALCAFLTSALMLETLKVCVQALMYTMLWRPVDPEVEEQLAQEATVVRAFGEQCKKVRPPCGYGLIQAKEEARKVQALRSLMRRCVCQLLFLLLVLMVNYQDSVEQSQGRQLHSSVRRCLYTTLTSLRDWSDAERWMNNTLIRHLHRSPSLRLVGLPRLRYTRALGSTTDVVLGNRSDVTHRLLADLRMADWSEQTFKTLSIDFTHYHRESGLFVCVSVQLAWTETQRIASSLSIYPLLIPSSFSGLDLQVALMVLLLISALLLVFGEMWSMATERAQYLCQCRHWLQLLLASLSLATVFLQLSFLSRASSCVSRLRSHPDDFIGFHSAALQAHRSSRCAAVLLTVLVLKLLRTLRFVRRWVAIGRVLRRSWRELWALAALLLLLLLLCSHLGNTLFSDSVEGFLSAREAVASVLSMLCGQLALRGLCRAQPVLGPIYGLLLMGGVFWLLARLCGTVLICTYREERAELHHPTAEPQDYEMVEFFIKRLKLWMGLTKAREFRHRVTFEGLDIPPSRSSQVSHLSSVSSNLPFSRSPSLSSSISSPCSLSSVLSVRSGDLETRFDVQPFVDRLVPSVIALLSQFDRVNQITEDVHNLEMKLVEAHTRGRKRQIINKEKSAESFGGSENPKEQEGEGKVTGEDRRRKTSVFYPRQRVSLPSFFPFNTTTLHPSAALNHIFLQTQNSESRSGLPQVACTNYDSKTTNPASAVHGLHPAGSLAIGQFPRRRAWHSGSSQSADAVQRAVLFPGGAVPCGEEHLKPTNIRPRSEEGIKRHISDGVPVKRKAWISEGPETEQN